MLKFQIKSSFYLGKKVSKNRLKPKKLDRSTIKKINYKKLLKKIETTKNQSTWNWKSSSLISLNKTLN